MSESSIPINNSWGQRMHTVCATAHTKINGHSWRLTDDIRVKLGFDVDIIFYIWLCHVLEITEIKVYKFPGCDVEDDANIRTKLKGGGSTWNMCLLKKEKKKNGCLIVKIYF